MKKVLGFLAVLLALIALNALNVMSKTIRVAERVTIRRTAAQEEADATMQAASIASSDDAGREINWQVISGGGTSCGSSNYRIGGTVAQTAAQTGVSTGYRMQHGYWQEFGDSLVDYICGDADGSRSVDIDDVVYLISFIFSGGPPPYPLEAGDADCSGGVDIDDVVYLINYIFTGGPEPCAGCDGKPAFDKAFIGTAELTLINGKDHQSCAVSHSVNTDCEVQAVQLEYRLHVDVRDINVKSRIDGIQEFHGIVDEVLRVGLLDLFGKMMIPSGLSNIVTISYAGNGEIELINSIVIARGGGRLDVTVVDRENVAVPRDYALHQNYPNPFNPATVISFSLPTGSHVKLDVYNIMGQKVMTVIDGYRPAGNHAVTWEGRGAGDEPVASGVYFYRIETSGFVNCKKMLLLK